MRSPLDLAPTAMGCGSLSCREDSSRRRSDQDKAGMRENLWRAGARSEHMERCKRGTQLGGRPDVNAAVRGAALGHLSLFGLIRNFSPVARLTYTAILLGSSTSASDTTLV